MPPDLLALFQAARLGDERALAELCICLVNRLRHFAYAELRNWHHADDVTQETLLAIVRAAQNRLTYQFLNEGSFLAFVFQIVRRQIWKIRRLQGRIPQADDPTDDLLRNLADPAALSEDYQAILEVVAIQSETDRALFDLLIQDCTSAEAGEQLGGVNASTIRWRWARARERLLRDLERLHPELVIRYSLRG